MADLFQLAFQDYKSQKKYSRMLLVLMSTAIIVFLCIHSLAGSIKNNLADIIYKPFGREFLIWIPARDEAGYWEEKEKIEEALAEEECIGNIVIHMGLTPAVWNDLKENNTIYFTAYITTIEDYAISGDVSNPKKGEIILPEYIYNMGSKNQYQYIKGSDYIGETIHITVKSGNNDEKKDYNFKVKGTFDNIRSMADGNIFCLSEEDALDIYQYYGLTGLDEFIEGIRQEYPNQLESFYNALNLQFNMAITVKSGYDFNAAGKMLREKFEGPSYVSTFFHEDANGISYMEFLIFLSDIMSFLIAIAASVSMVLMFIADMRRRKYDFALRYSMGYTAARQILLYGMEKMIIFMRAVIISVFITVICVAGGNYMIQNIAPFYRRSIVLSLDWITIGITFAIVLILCSICVLLAAFRIRKIDTARVLKEESL